MTKRVLIAALGILLVLGFVGGTKWLQIRKMIAQGEQFTPPPETITAAVVEEEQWESVLTAVGSLEAVQGITVTAELPGKIVNLAFEAGSSVDEGDLLVRQDTAMERAQLKSAEAAAALAKVNFERARELLPDRVVSQSDYDQARAEYRQAAAQLDNIRAMIEKKTIRAPFAGRLGIRLVHLGQVIDNGQAIVSLQSLDPIFVNFSLPQQHLTRLLEGLPVRISSDALPGAPIEGHITAVNPEVDSATRNVRVQATAANPQEQLFPGMFVQVGVVLPEKENVLVIPATAVFYAPYSNSVFVVEEAEEGKAGKIVRQQFVELGERRGDFVAVRSGVQAGDVVASTGVFKLRNGQSVVVDNTLAPEFKLAPEPREG